MTCYQGFHHHESELPGPPVNGEACSHFVPWDTHVEIALSASFPRRTKNSVGSVDSGLVLHCCKRRFKMVFQERAPLIPNMHSAKGITHAR